MSTPSIFEDNVVEASLSTHPTTPGDVIVRLKNGALSDMAKLQLVESLLAVKKVASIVKVTTKVQRVALLTTSDNEVRLTPLHGLGNEWKPAMDPQLEYHPTYPGYVTSRSGPPSSKEVLDQAQAELTNGNSSSMDFTCPTQDDNAQNLFAKIIRGELEQWRIWESESHVAFLTPFGSAPGKTVLVPRKHSSSDILSLPDEDLAALAAAICDVTQMIVHSEFKADRVGLIFEGMEINWAHAKLTPIYGDGPRTVPEQPFKEIYDGAVSSQSGPLASQDNLRQSRRMFAPK